MGTKVCHLTTVHQRYDVRIFHKECKSLSRAGFEVNLIVADGLGDEEKDGIKIWDVGKPSGRKERMLKFGKKALQKALEIDAQIYHFHDPELIPVGLKLKKHGKKVIYDVHEDVPLQLRYKPYMNKFLARIVSDFFKAYEHKAVRKFDYLFVSVPSIQRRLERYNRNILQIRNYPKIQEEFKRDFDWESKIYDLCYIGGISRNRGIVQIVKALEQVEATLHLAGPFLESGLEQELKSFRAWNKVVYHGVLDRAEVVDLLYKTKIGLVTLLPTKNYQASLPIKLFEYMSAGLAVVASNFPYWQELIEENKIGLRVDPTKPEEIASAIRYLLENEDKAKEFGFNAFRVVREKYSWTNEEKKLISTYKKLSKQEN